jgi:phenylacetate-CoA ligase
MGWRPGMAIIVVWGSERDIGKSTTLRKRLQNSLLNTFLIDGYNLTERTAQQVVATIRRHHPLAIFGFTSMLEFVAAKALELKIAPPPGSVKTAWNSGEMLFEHQSRMFQKAFGVPILNWYGGRELSTMAFQDREGSPLHVVRPFHFVEVVGDDGRPVGPGEPGRLLWTSTVCRGTPFLRYDIGDIGLYDQCHNNGAGIVAIRELHGRVAGLLSLPNGKKINCLYWNHLFKQEPEVQQFQVILKKDGRLSFLLKGRGFTADREASLRTTIGNFLGGIPLEISWVDRIPLTPQGKLVQVVREQ